MTENKTKIEYYLLYNLMMHNISTTISTRLYLAKTYRRKPIMNQHTEKLPYLISEKMK